MDLVISDEVLQAAHMSRDELQRELAVMLYSQGRLSLGRASRLAEMDLMRFQLLLASRAIPTHYDTDDFRQDVETLSRLGRQ